MNEDLARWEDDGGRVEAPPPLFVLVCGGRLDVGAAARVEAFLRQQRGSSWSSVLVIPPGACRVEVLP